MTVPVLVATLAVVHEGFPVSRLALDDGGVWLTSGTDLALGRFNVPVSELDGGLGTATPDFDVLQDGDDVLLVEGAEISVVDPATVATTERVMLDAGATVGMAGGTVMVLDRRGDLWVRPVDRVSELSAGPAPDARLGEGGAAVVARSGAVLTVTGGGQTTTRPTPGSSPVSGGQVAGLGTVDQITAVGDEPVVLDGATVRTRRGSTDMPGTGLMLQQPGPADRHVLVASTDALYEVPLDGGDPVVRPTGSTGAPAAPVRVGGCAYGAWAAPTGNWVRVCGSTVDQVDREEVSAADDLRFRVNRNQVVLNDVVTGRVWVADDTAVRKPDWQQIKPQQQPDPDADSGEEPSEQLTAQCSEEGRPPVARDDEYGVRPGRTTTLRVLANDTTSDCGILVISSVDEIPASFGSLRVVDAGRALEVDVAASATGSVTFTYTVTDRPGVRAPATATVRLDVRDHSLNAPPVQVSVTTMQVGQGGSLRADVLSDFVDPDGDPLVMVGASMDGAYGSITYRPDGVVTVTATGQVGSTTATVMVSDGIAEPVAGVVEVVVREGGVAPQVDPVHAVGHVNRPLTVFVLDAVRSTGAEPVRLAGVGDVAGATVVPDLASGSFTFVATSPGTYYVSFTVVSSPNQAVGWARIDIADLPTELVPPVTMGDIAYLPAGGSVTVDPLANDEDPNGLVLVLQSVTVPDGSGLRVGVVEHRLVVISAVRTLSAPTPITYTVSNGALSATGTILVVPVPPSASNQPPVVPDREVTVRTGGVVTVDVLTGAYDPEGGALTLDPTLPQELPATQGLLFVSGDVLRYQAPSTPMTVTAMFSVSDPAGASTAARLTVHVRSTDAGSKPPPTPEDLTARVYDGETVRISVPLTGIDPDGDGVTLLGLGDTSPTRGVVTKVGADYLEYRALAGESGTDTFTYAVEDWTGQRAVATVRVGIVPRPADAASVLARDDEVTVRPGFTVEVPVLANDIDSGGGRLSLDPELVVSGDLGTGAGAGSVTVAGSVVVVRAPQRAGVVQVQYTARNDRGGQGSAVLTVIVTEDAPVLPPVAADVVVPATDTIGRTRVEVDVLALARNPSGPLSELDVVIPASSAATASVTSTRQVLITLTDRTQVIAYQLVSTRDPDASAYAFITVPALGFFPPTVRPKAPALRVGSGQSIEISLDAQVQVAPGRKPSLADVASLRATRGTATAVGAGTVRFTAEDGYAGQASVTMLVTDATGSTDAQARQATITLPITVYAADAHPPTFTPTTVTVGPGDDPVTVDLTAFMRTPEGTTPREGDYTVTRSGAVPVGFTVALEGSRLTVSAAATTPKGTSGWLELVIGYGQTGSMQVSVPLKVVASTRPLARVMDRQLDDGQAGKPRTVDVLADAFDPFAAVGGSLTVVGAVVETPGAGTVSFGAGSVTLHPGDDFIGDMVVRFGVRDMTGDVDRQVEGRVVLRVAALPAAPAAPRVVETRDQAVVLAWTAPDARGAAITGYRVTASPGGATFACPVTTCLVSGLSNGTSYTFTVAAQNAVGWSPESPPSSPVNLDTVPEAPAAPSVTGADGAVEARWDVPPSRGSAVVSYEVQISPAPDRPSDPSVVRATTTSARFSGLTNGRSYTVRVRAYNASPEPGPWSAWSQPVIPSGAPDAPQAFTASRVDTPAGRQIELTWRAPANNGSPLGAYVLEISGAGTSRTVAPAADATRYVMTDAVNGVSYTFRLQATNAAGTSPPATTSASAFGAPGKPTITSFVGASGGAHGAGTATVTWAAGADNGAPVTSYRVSVDGGPSVDAGGGTSFTVGSLRGGQAVSVRVQACNVAGCGDWSDARNASPVPQTAPSAVTGLGVQVSTDAQGQPTRATASWSAPDWGGVSAGRHHVVSWAVDGVVVVTTTSTGTSASLTQDLPVLGAGRPSATVSVTVTPATGVGSGPAATASQVVSWAQQQIADVTGLVVVPGGGQTLRWDQVPGAVAYEWRALLDGAVIFTGRTDQLTATIGFQTPPRSVLLFQVRAVAADGSASASWTSVQVNP